MQGIAREKFHAMEHEYPSKIELIDKYGYDGKQLSHLLRVEDYLERYITGEMYEKCLKPTDPQLLIDTKLNRYPLLEGRTMAQKAIYHIDEMTIKFLSEIEKKSKAEVDILLDQVQYDIMKKSLTLEIL